MGLTKHGLVVVTTEWTPLGRDFLSACKHMAIQKFGPQMVTQIHRTPSTRWGTFAILPDGYDERNEESWEMDRQRGHFRTWVDAEWKRREMEGLLVGKVDVVEIRYGGDDTNDFFVTREVADAG